MQQYQKLVQEDLNVGTGLVWVTGPAAGDLLSTQTGLHSVARNQKSATSTWAPGAIAAGSYATTTIAVTSAVKADLVTASHDKVLTSALRLTGHVSAAGTVTVVLHNPTASAVTVASGTLSVLVFPARVPPVPTPYAYYKMEEASGNLLDSIGTKHLVPFAAPTYQATGKSNYAIEMTAGKVVWVSSGFPTSAGHSISLWCKFSGTDSTVSQIAGSMSGTNCGPGRITTSFGIYHATTFHAGSSGRTADEWYHLVYTFDGSSTHKLYVNGELDATHTGSGPGATDFEVNNTAGANTHVVDEVGWFNRVLNIGQVCSLYNDGDGLFWPWS